ncbi:MAG: hypothetical protein JWP97_4904 [Labilithrix sp.]|nr:hypothetical protein [Labilithrix sp.]
MKRTPLDTIVSSAPLLLAFVVAVQAARAEVSLTHAGGFITLLMGWGIALETLRKRAARRAHALASRQELEASVQRAVTMAETEDDLLDVTGQATGQILPGSPAELLLADETGSEIHLAAIASAGAPGCPVDCANGCPALRSGQTQSFAHIDAIDVCPRLRGRPGGPKPALCVPLAVMGRTIGVLHATTTAERPFTPDQVASLEGLASHAGSRLRMLQLVDELQRQASTDSLTGLPNRRSFEERATRALSRRTPLLVAIADVDQFKRLNDTHGHAAGDNSLRVFAEALRLSFGGKNDIVARLGGEEFAIVLPRADAEDVREVFARARTILADLIQRQGGIPFTASYGVALAPDHGSSVSQLLAAADRALYVAKASGRDRAVIVGDVVDQATAVRKSEVNIRTLSVAPLPASTIESDADATRVRRGVA